jgi:hypothetical protein
MQVYLELETTLQQTRIRQKVIHSTKSAFCRFSVSPDRTANFFWFLTSRLNLIERRVLFFVFGQTSLILKLNLIQKTFFKFSIVCFILLITQILRVKITTRIVSFGSIEMTKSPETISFSISPAPGSRLVGRTSVLGVPHPRILGQHGFP